MKLLLGDCLDKLKELDDNSVDSIVTDPPYGLSFMGKKWDYDVPSQAIWEECMRVLKPGGHILSFAGSRTYHRMAVRIEDAGFEIRDQIMWIYGSGFPKSHNIGKAIDKKQGIISHSILELKQIIIDYFNQSGLKKNEFDKLCNFRAASYMRTESREDDGWGEAIPSNEKWTKIKQVLNIDTDEYDELFQSAVRDVVGRGSSGIGKAFTKEGWHSETMEFDITEAKNEEAKEWEGWGTALKPAHEPIVMARKPLTEKSIAENVLKYGTGGINIDGCRIETDEELGRFQIDGNGPLSPKHGFNNNSMSNGDKFIEGNPNGRFPANIIFDEEAGKILDEQTGVLTSGFMKAGTPRKMSESNVNTYGHYDSDTSYRDTYGDSGGASRFFYCPKTSKKDRNEGLDEFEKKVTMRDDGQPYGMNTNQFRPDGSKRKPVEPKSNHHPTVKPTDLMAYLIRLVTPKGGIVLDPFMGSGSTGKAAVREGIDFIGIERDNEYFEIAKSRIESEKKKPIIVKTPTGKKVEVRREVEEKVNQFFG
jgi:DNA modification methylase